MFRKSLSTMFILLLMFVVLSGLAVAQEEFPTKPIDIIAGDPPGGTTDMAARALAATASPFLNNVDINVVNMPGGAHMVAFDYVVSQVEPDGYTLVVAYGEHHSKTLLGVDLPVNVDPDPKVGAFRPVIGSLAYTSALVVPYDSPFETLEDLVEYGKENPGKLTWGYTGAFGVHWIMGESFLADTGIEAEGISLGGGAATRQGVTGGHVDFGILATFLVPDFLNDNLMRALAVFAPERDPIAEDVPTMRELGYSVLDALSFKTIGAPSDTPDWKIEKLYEGFKEATETTAFKQIIEGQGLIVTGWSPEEAQKKAQEYDDMIEELIEKGVIKTIE
jgi:tripartite-type tricarboxylate transporter receptor subunit TctC